MNFISIKWIYELFYKRRPIVVCESVLAVSHCVRVCVCVSHSPSGRTRCLFLNIAKPVARTSSYWFQSSRLELYYSTAAQRCYYYAKVSRWQFIIPNFAFFTHRRTGASFSNELSVYWGWKNVTFELNFSRSQCCIVSFHSFVDTVGQGPIFFYLSFLKCLLSLPFDNDPIVYCGPVSLLLLQEAYLELVGMAVFEPFVLILQAFMTSKNGRCRLPLTPSWIQNATWWKAKSSVSFPIPLVTRLDRTKPKYHSWNWTPHVAVRKIRSRWFQAISFRSHQNSFVSLTATEF